MSEDFIALALIEAARKAMERAVAEHPEMEAKYRERFAVYALTGGTLKSPDIVQ